MDNIKYERLCQALAYVSHDVMLSRLYLDFAVMPHLNQTEARILEALWHRTARFGRNNPVILTVEDFRSGAGPNYTEHYLLPNYSVSDRAFYKYVKTLRKLRLISDYTGRGKLITCYPRDFIDLKGTLINALERDKERGPVLMESLDKATKHFAAQTDYLLEKAGKRSYDTKLVAIREESDD